MRPGTVTVWPGATLERSLAFLQDYDHHAANYAPDVMISKTLEHNGNDFKIHMRFLKKKVITVVEDTWQDVQYVSINPQRAYSRAVTTRVQEVENAGKPDEQLKPPGQGGGFLWHLNSYWRFEERDGGVYIQCEAVSLTRGIPWYAQLVRGFITSIPKESLIFTLGTTRARLVKQPASDAR